MRTYILHCDKYPNRLSNVKKLCDNLSFNYEIILCDTTKYSHQKNVSFDSIKLIDTAISNNFYPFLILEDDAALIDVFPNQCNILTNVDLIYWGSNIKSGPPVIKNKLKLENYDDYYYRLYNSQSSHAIIVPNNKSAILLKSIYKIAFNMNFYHDVMLANISQHKTFVTPKNGPYFYQNDGRNHHITKFKWINLNLTQN